MEDAGLMADGERDKEIMLIAKRGIGVDYEEKKGSPLLKNDIRREMPGKTWKEIRSVCIDRAEDGTHLPLSDDEGDEGDTVEIDSYKYVDEYVWILEWRLYVLMLIRRARA